MSFKILAAAVLLALSAAGAEPVLPTLRIEPTTGGSIFYLKNVSSQALTAYVIELVDYPGSYFSMWQDELTSEPVAPNEERRIPVSNMTVGAAPDYVKVRAAIYADGSTAGNAEMVSKMVSCRRFSLDAMQGLIHRIETMQEAKLSSAAAAANVRNAMQFMLVPPGTDRSSQIWINQSAGRDLYIRTAQYLEKHSVDETVARLREWEKALSQSKPALGGL